MIAPHLLHVDILSSSMQHLSVFTWQDIEFVVATIATPHAFSVDVQRDSQKRCFPFVVVNAKTIGSLMFHVQLSFVVVSAKTIGRLMIHVQLLRQMTRTMLLLSVDGQVIYYTAGWRDRKSVV